MEQRERPIGFFDSGAGGLTLLKPAAALLPRERMLYYGDSANAPYGVQPPRDILAHTLRAADILTGAGIKLLVVACNTATSVAAPTLRARLSIPVVAVEPALKPASRLGATGRIIVLATRATLGLPRFAQSMAQYGSRAVAVPVFGLVERIEAGETDGPGVRAALEAALLPALAEPCDAIVLGCTHYAFVRPVIEAMAGPGVAVLDGTAGTLAQLYRLLETGGLLRLRGRGSVCFRSSVPGPEGAARLRKLYEGYTPQAWTENLAIANEKTE